MVDRKGRSVSGITSNIGIFSGIDSGSLIEQLLSVAARPKILAQRRITQLQLQQSGYLDINSRLLALKSAAAAFRTDKVFQTQRVSSSAPEVLTASASTAAREGSYALVVDRLVTTQQVLSKGFVDRGTSPVGASTFTFEGAQARLDRDMALADLNGGNGIQRGSIQVRDSDGNTATVDLSKAATVGDVLTAISDASGVEVTASVEGGSLVIKDDAGGAGTMQVSDLAGSTTAASLGIAKSAVSGKLTGDRVYYVAAGTSLQTLNDGKGVYISDTVGVDRYDFSLKIGTDPAVKINLGPVYDSNLEVTEAKVTTIGGALTRINESLADAGYTDVTAALNAEGNRIVITDVSGDPIEVVPRSGALADSALDLGLTGTSTGGVLTGRQILADLNSTLASALKGGAGRTSLGDGALSFTLRNGATFNVTLQTDASLSSIARQIETASGTNPSGSARVLVSLNEEGTGLLVKDNTGSTSQNFRIEGNTGTPSLDTAAILGISTGPAGVASSTKDSGNLQHQYLSVSTTLASLNQGRGVGTGTFTITDSTGATRTIDIGSDSATLGDVIREINSSGSRVQARINDKGDGILLYENTGGGASKISVEDAGGSVARSLNIAGEAAGTGVQNFIDGSLERTVEFETTDTLDDIARKINEAGVGVSATIVNDGSGSTPFRLNLVSRSTGTAGRFLLDTGGFDIGARLLDKGEDARVFFGSTDPAQAVLLTSSTNTLDSLIEGVTIDLNGTSSAAVTLSVSRDTSAIEESIQTFVTVYNDLISRIDFQTRYDPETEAKGLLLGDSTMISLRSALFNTLFGPAQNISGRFERLTDVGIEIAGSGQISLDRDRLRRAIEEDAAGVEALFTARESSTNTPTQVLPNNPNITVRNTGETFTSLGVAGQLEELAKRYTDSIDGVLTERGRALDNQIEIQQSRVTQIDFLLANRRDILSRQFVAMEKAIAQLQSQQSSLSSIGRR